MQFRHLRSEIKGMVLNLLEGMRDNAKPIAGSLSSDIYKGVMEYVRIYS